MFLPPPAPPPENSALPWKKVCGRPCSLCLRLHWSNGKKSVFSLQNKITFRNLNTIFISSLRDICLFWILCESYRNLVLRVSKFTKKKVLLTFACSWTFNLTFLKLFNIQICLLQIILNLFCSNSCHVKMVSLLPLLQTESWQSVTDLDLRSEISIFDNFWTERWFFRQFGSSENWHQPKTKPPLANFSCPILWNAL